jgi:hypothetical protein
MRDKKVIEYIFLQDCIMHKLHHADEELELPMTEEEFRNYLLGRPFDDFPKTTVRAVAVIGTGGELEDIPLVVMNDLYVYKPKFTGLRE